ncbi:MAG: type I restriction-modification system subunit M N-terminal domain-containing protein, partial [Methylomonas sp.]|nr:type I restriction-modification system subunit M N-terminal domain-containing protein [Methylomonas sp.]
FGMLFLKRMSDVFNDRYDQIIAEQLKLGRSLEQALQRAESISLYPNGFVPKTARWSYPERARKIDGMAEHLADWGPIDQGKHLGPIEQWRLRVWGTSSIKRLAHWLSAIPRWKACWNTSTSNARSAKPRFQTRNCAS